MILDTVPHFTFLESCHFFLFDYTVGRKNFFFCLYSLFLLVAFSLFKHRGSNQRYLIIFEL